MGQAADDAAGQPADIMTAIRTYLEANDLAALRQAIETHQETLFSQEVAEIFQANIEQAREAGEEQAAEMLTFHLELLQACQAEGIAKAFSRLEEAVREGANQADSSQPMPAGNLPDDFVARCVTGITGTPGEKQAAFNYLTALSPRLPQAGPLILAVQQAIFGADPDTLGHKLTGENAQVWAEIYQALSNK